MQAGDTPLAEYLSLVDAAAKLPTIGGKKTHWLTIRRWILKGLKGVKLQAKKVGGRWCTTLQWIEDFINASTEQASGPIVRNPADKRRSHVRARRALDTQFGYYPLPLGMDEKTARQQNRISEWEDIARKQASQFRRRSRNR